MQMMKVKIWDKETKAFQDIISVDFTAKAIVLSDCFKDITYERNFEDVIFVKYTWLRDIDNKEIYEGDIVKIFAMNIF